MRKAGPLLLLAVALAAGPALAGGGRLHLLGGEIRRGITLRSVEGGKLTYLDGGGKEREADVSRVVSLSLGGVARPAEAPGPADVEVRLRGGDVVRGRLVPGKEDHLSLVSPLLGRLLLSADDVGEVRFLEAWSSVSERPAPAEKGGDRDVFVYRNLDELDGTYLRTTPRAIVAHTRISPAQAIDFEKLLTIRFADSPAPPVSPGRIAVLLLADGSRVTARDLASDGKLLRATTLRGHALEVELRSVVALYQTGGRFVYLSDLPRARERIVPWMGESYAWDRPRYDRSFLDRPLRAGGETFPKGIGVISGTSITWRIEGKGYGRFTSHVALDDAAGPGGDVVFTVLVDGETRYRSEVVRRLRKGKDPLRIPPLDVEGAKEITLRVEYVDDFVMDFADWLDPMFIRAAPEPR